MLHLSLWSSVSFRSGKEPQSCQVDLTAPIDVPLLSFDLPFFLSNFLVLPAKYEFFSCSSSPTHARWGTMETSHLKLFNRCSKWELALNTWAESRDFRVFSKFHPQGYVTTSRLIVTAFLQDHFQSKWVGKCGSLHFNGQEFWWRLHLTTPLRTIPWMALTSEAYLIAQVKLS